MKRRVAREKALQALFQIDVSKTEWKDAVEHVLEGVKPDEYLVRLVSGVTENLSQIDEVLKKYLEKWTMERLAIVDRNILRLAVYELLYCGEDVPANVALDEAIEIAKVFGDDNSSRFINGVLSKVNQSRA